MMHYLILFRFAHNPRALTKTGARPYTVQQMEEMDLKEVYAKNIRTQFKEWVFIMVVRLVEKKMMLMMFKHEQCYKLSLAFDAQNSN